MKNFDYKKSLGQNFLIDKNIIAKITDSIIAGSKDLIIEIGPGAGALTIELVKKDAQVLCFEIDERLKEKLSKIDANNLEIVYEDFLKIDVNKYISSRKYNKLIFVGNLPYYITTAIINKIIKECSCDEIIIMVQKEVGNRFMANSCSKEYGSISVFLQYHFNISKICNVSKNCFEPVPKVDSVVLKLTKRRKSVVINEEHFYKLIKDSFKQKRKTIKNNLYGYDLKKVEEILSKHNKTLKCRAEELTVDEFIEISNFLN